MDFTDIICLHGRRTGWRKGTNLQGPKGVEDPTKIACIMILKSRGVSETARVQGPECCAAPLFACMWMAVISEGVYFFGRGHMVGKKCRVMLEPLAA